MARHDADSAKPVQDYGLFGYCRRGKECWGVRLRISGRLREKRGFGSKTEAKAFRDKARGERFEGVFFPAKYQRRQSGEGMETLLARHTPTKPTNWDTCRSVPNASIGMSSGSRSGGQPR